MNIIKRQYYHEYSLSGETEGGKKVVILMEQVGAEWDYPQEYLVVIRV